MQHQWATQQCTEECAGQGRTGREDGRASLHRQPLPLPRSPARAWCTHAHPAQRSVLTDLPQVRPLLHLGIQLLVVVVQPGGSSPGRPKSVHASWQGAGGSGARTPAPGPALQAAARCGRRGPHARGAAPAGAGERQRGSAKRRRCSFQPSEGARQHEQAHPSGSAPSKPSGFSCLPRWPILHGELQAGCGQRSSGGAPRNCRHTCTCTQRAAQAGTAGTIHQCWPASQVRGPPGQRAPALTGSPQEGGGRAAGPAARGAPPHPRPALGRGPRAKPKH